LVAEEKILMQTAQPEDGTARDRIKPGNGVMPLASTVSVLDVLNLCFLLFLLIGRLTILLFHNLRI
jgi:hypothetical protein